jgi:hypothetical protein
MSPQRQQGQKALGSVSIADRQDVESLLALRAQ